MKKTLLSLSICMVLFWACNNVDKSNKTDAKTNNESVSENSSKTTETVYVASNKEDGNTVVAFNQNDDGSLTKLGEYQTGGKGTGKIEIFDWGYDETHPLKDGVDPLISAYGIFKTQDGKFVLVVNPGDGTISSLKVMDDKSLKLVDTQPSGDIHPLSIASHGDLVYVANSAESSAPPFAGNLMGFKVSEEGKLIAIENSKRNLNARPACIAFTPDGKYLVVTELVTGLVKVYGFDSDGLISNDPISMASCPHDAENGRWLPIPVGFDIVTRGTGYTALVSEARFLNNKGALREEAGKVPQSPLYSWQTGSTSSFNIDENGMMSLKSGDVYTGSEMEGGQIANCWVEASEDGDTLWAANGLSSSITVYSIGEDGELKMTSEKGYKDEKEELFFSDLAASNEGEYIYQLIGNKGQVLVLKVESTENLEYIGIYDGLPAVGAFGLVVI